MKPSQSLRIFRLHQDIPTTLNERRIKDPLLAALTRPETLLGRPEGDWADLLNRARDSGLFTRLEALLVQRGIIDKIPERARLQLADARAPVSLNQIQIRFEVNRLARALATLDIPIILLKGAAYFMANLPPAGERFSADVDIMVEKQHLDAVEQTLLAAGWQMADVTEYDEAYFRKWMHEIPPMWHPSRLIAADVHHTIVPVTSRYQPDTKALFSAALPLDGANLKILCPADMILHGSAHLFNEEFVLALRDLADLHDLLGHFEKAEGFWDDLLTRAHRHGLERVLFYLLRYTRRLFSTQVPAVLDEGLRLHAPNRLLRATMDIIVMLALTPPSPGRRHPLRALALTLLRMHSHWIKMPPLLLTRHLVTKALYRRRRGGRPSWATSGHKRSA